jgi:hypothetical protein
MSEDTNKVIQPDSNLIKSNEGFPELSEIFWKRYYEISNKDYSHFLEVHAKVRDFYQRLVKKYTYEEVIKRKISHILGGSSYYDHDTPYLDFEGEDSIEKFIREL